MKIAILGAGAMGSVIGGLLARGGNDVTLIDVSRDTVDAINRDGLRIQDKAGEITRHRIGAVNSPSQIRGTVDLVIVFVKCYHTAKAVESALPIIGPETTVLSLQNGWGNGSRIAAVVGERRVVLGVCYHSATVMAPGHVLHGGYGKTVIGERDGAISPRLLAIAQAFDSSGIPIEPSNQVQREIWSKLSLNVATLPASALTRVTADRLLDTAEMRALMRELLREVVAVANAQDIALDFEERWDAIAGLLSKLAPGAKGSMLQDIEKHRATEIDVICGAIVDAGRRFGIATPYNHSMHCLIKALEASFVTKGAVSAAPPLPAPVLSKAV